MKIWWHKRRARIARNRMIDIEHSLDCGMLIAETISPRYARAKATYHRHLDWLQENDDAFPPEHLVVAEKRRRQSSELCGND